MQELARRQQQNATYIHETGRQNLTYSCLWSSANSAGSRNGIEWEDSNQVVKRTGRYCVKDVQRKYRMKGREQEEEKAEAEISILKMIILVHQ